LEEPPTGLTPASLKHLRRQRDLLAEEKVRLQAELATALRKLKEQCERVTSLEAGVEEAEIRHREACSREEAQCQRADELSRLKQEVAARLTASEAELLRTKTALEEQRRLTREVCETAAAASAGRSPSATEAVPKLQGEVDGLRCDLRQRTTECEELRRGAAKARAAAEAEVAALRARPAQRDEQLRAAKLAEAINQKVELHISVPRLTLSYNDAPPLLVSVAAGLVDERLRTFLDREVFPYFEPLWVRLDSLDCAPDGSSKKAYSTRMLERLTAAVRGFVQKAQEADLPAPTPARGTAKGAPEGDGGDAPAGKPRPSSLSRFLAAPSQA